MGLVTGNWEVPRECEYNRGTGCGKSARPGLWRGRRKTGVPTAEASMRIVCPRPQLWNETYESLVAAWEASDCAGEMPPKPLVLAGWAYSNDAEKLQRWKATRAWARENGLGELIPGLDESNSYIVREINVSCVGPLGGPCYLPWNLAQRSRPSLDELKLALERLREAWPKLSEGALGVLYPVRFTGKKARRLLVIADLNAVPPWGSWVKLVNDERRRAFTTFRAAINNKIAPHEVDHVSFISEKDA